MGLRINGHKSSPSIPRFLNPSISQFNSIMWNGSNTSSATDCGESGSLKTYTNLYPMRCFPDLILNDAHNFQARPIMVISRAVFTELITTTAAQENVHQELYHQIGPCCCHSSNFNIDDDYAAECWWSSRKRNMKKSHKHRILLWPYEVRIVQNQLILLWQNH